MMKQEKSLDNAFAEQNKKSLEANESKKTKFVYQ